MKSLFSSGYRGLSDSLFSGQQGSVYRSVGIDSRSEPGLLKVHQKLTKDSSTVIDELCKVAVPVSDGSKLWFSSESGKIWREVSGTYTLLDDFDITEWDIRTLGFTGESLDVTTNTVSSSQFLGIRDASFGDTKFHMGRYGSQFIYGYKDADKGYNLSEFVYDDLFDHSAQTSASRAYYMNPTGTKWYVASDTVIYQYSPGANIDISGSAYDSKSFTPGGGVTSIFFFHMNTDGTKLYIGNASSDPVIYQYTMSTAFDVSTATYDSVSFSLGTEIDSFRFPAALSITPDGKYIVAYADPVGGSRLLFFQYEMTTPFDLSTAVFRKKMNFRSPTFDNNIRSIYFQDISPYGVYEGGNRMFISTDSVTANLNGSISTSSDGPYVVYEFSMSDADQDGIVLGAEEHVGLFPDLFDNVFSPATADLENHVYFATASYLFKFRTSDIADFDNKVIPAGTFLNGGQFHSMVRQNETLFIADANILASVSSLGVFTQQTGFNLPQNENITAITDFDIDILIGTKSLTDGRALRWDGVSPSWSAEDEIYVKGGVSAFLSDDNYRYVLDEDGTIWFYNGEQCEVAYRLPEVGNDTIKVNPNAVGYFKKTPVFGLSNGSGNPVIQGIYGLGKYSRGYSTSLTLDYPISTDEFSGVEIGAIVVDGNDLYASWKTATGQGVDKIDYTAKYASAYMETMALSDPSERHQIKTLSETLVPYFSLPASTGVTIGIKKSYDGSFTNMTVLDDTKRKLVKLKSPSVTDCANPQLRIGFTVNSNDAPEVEDVLYGIAPVGRK